MLALPYVLIKKTPDPPLLGDWQRCDPPLLRHETIRIAQRNFYFIDTTTDADIQSVTETSDCSFRRYEGVRLHSLKQQVTSAKENWGGEMEDNGRDLGVSVYETANALLENIEKAESEMWKVKS